jgi:hypothetical protein
LCQIFHSLAIPYSLNISGCLLEFPVQRVSTILSHRPQDLYHLKFTLRRKEIFSARFRFADYPGFGRSPGG